MKHFAGLRKIADHRGPAINRNVWRGLDGVMGGHGGSSLAQTLPVAASKDKSDMRQYAMPNRRMRQIET
jgi:hypothetical protein